MTGDAPFPGTADVVALESWLGHRVGRPVLVVFTQNRRTMLSSRWRSGQLELRLHELFLSAGAAEFAAVLAYVVAGQAAAGGRVDAFIAAQLALRPAAPRRPRPPPSPGQVHDLARLFADLNDAFFHRACRASIGWGRAGQARRRRSIQLGCYESEEAHIRIHPCLDQFFVPEFYLAWVIYHEMLHETLGVPTAGGRRQLHSPEFRALEACHPDYQRARIWERQHLGRLLRFGLRSCSAG